MHTLPRCIVLFSYVSMLFAEVSEQIHTAYYNWYGNGETDGALRHWNHEVLNVTPPRQYPGGDDIGANYYPQLGNYSSNDTNCIKTHMEQLLSAGVGVITVTWWGIGSFEDQGLGQLFDIAGRYGIKVNFHLEPFYNGNIDTVRAALVYLLDKFGHHPALYTISERGNRPMVYIYDSYKTANSEWARLFKEDGNRTVRGGEYDIVALGLWVEAGDGNNIRESCFDGFYTYFATDGFTWGSTTANWATMADWAENNNKLFVPCVGPGYIDTRIRPWNAVNTRSRENGAYFDRMFQAACAVMPSIISITSFNEWHEGTQIEPAVPKQITDYTYEDYLPNNPDFYLKRTQYWVKEFIATQNQWRAMRVKKMGHLVKTIRNTSNRTIRVIFSDGAGPVEISIFTINGTLIQKRLATLRGEETEILDVSGFGPGVYVLCITDAEQSTTGNVILY